MSFITELLSTPSTTANVKRLPGGIVQIESDGEIHDFAEILEEVGKTLNVEFQGTPLRFASPTTFNGGRLAAAFRFPASTRPGKGEATGEERGLLANAKSLYCGAVCVVLHRLGVDPKDIRYSAGFTGPSGWVSSESFEVSNPTWGAGAGGESAKAKYGRLAGEMVSIDGGIEHIQKTKTTLESIGIEGEALEAGMVAAMEKFLAKAKGAVISAMTNEVTKQLTETKTETEETAVPSGVVDTSNFAE